MLEDNKRWFVFCGDKLLLERCNDKSRCYRLPNWQTAPIELADKGERMISLPEGDSRIEELLKDGDREFIALREAHSLIDKEDYTLAGRAKEILHFDANSRFCPACGSKTERIGERVKRCGGCSKEIYPTITPAVVVRITHGDEILLIRSRSIRYNVMGFVAGFLEVGETLEECIEREIMEEVGLRVKDIRYFGSQPWPYPSGVMIGYTAEYEAGSLTLQEEEVSKAAFYTKDTLPDNIPPKLSIARRMIDEWLER